MSIKGIPHERDYKISQLPANSKARRVAEERQTRYKRYEALSPKEKDVYALLQEYGVAQMEAVAKERTVDEAIYAKKIIEVLEANYG